MQKTTSVSIGGRAFICDQPAYEVIQKYLARCGRKLADNPDKDEIIEDIEHSIAEHLRESSKDEVVSEKLAHATIAAIGEVDSEEPEANEEKQDADPWFKIKAAWKRFGRVEPDKSRAILFGTAAGIGKEFDIDPLWVRLAFIALSLGRGSGVFLYLIISFLIYNRGHSAQTAANLIKEAGQSVSIQPYERAFRKFFKAIWYSIRLVVAAAALALFMVTAIGLTTVLFFLITDPARLGVFGGYRDWLHILWLISVGLAIVLPTFMLFIAAARWKRVFKAIAVLVVVWLAAIIFGAASSFANIPRLRDWAVEHNVQNPYLYVTKIQGKPIDVCVSARGDCSLLTSVRWMKNDACSYRVYDRTRLEARYGLRYHEAGSDWVMRTKYIPQPMTDEAVCSEVAALQKETPAKDLIFTDRPYYESFVVSEKQGDTFVDSQVYALDYLEAEY